MWIYWTSCRAFNWKFESQHTEITSKSYKPSIFKIKPMHECTKTTLCVLDIKTQFIWDTSHTLVSHSLAWDWVPVESQWLLPSNHQHQEKDFHPAHGSHVSSVGLNWFQVLGWGTSQSIRELGEQVGSWKPAETERKNNKSAARCNSIPLSA